MNLKNSLHWALLGLLVGAFSGYELKGHNCAEREAFLAVGYYADNLMQDSATLALMTRGDTDCLRSEVSSRIRTALEDESFYRSMAAARRQDVSAIDRAVGLGTEVLRESTRTNSAAGSACH